MIQTIQQLIQTLFQNFSTAFVSQYIFIGIFYIVIWVLFAKRLAKFRIQTQKRAGWVQISEEFKYGMIALLVNSMITPVLFKLSESGIVKIYSDINLYGGIWYVLFTSVFLLLVSDGWFYWTHRWLHTPKVYKYIHALHHKSLDTTPFTSLSFHIIEAILQTAFVYILIFIIPINTLAIVIVQVLGLLNNIKSHLGYEFYPVWFSKTPLKYLINSTHHNLHHTRYNGNYGLMFTWWDIWFGTEFDNQDQVTTEINHRKTAPKITDNSNYKSLTISKLVRETADTISVYFEPEDKRFYDYKPGQYINLRFNLGFGKTYDRVFSLSSSPLDKFLRITVKKHAVVTEYLNTIAKVGDMLQALYPSGDFYIEPKLEAQNHYLLVAGGSGITPLYSMLRTVLKQEPKSTITLFYANKNEDSVIFSQELKELQKLNKQLTIKYFISGKNRLTKEDITDVLTKYPRALTFVCGPENLKIAIKNYIKEYQKNSDIREEDFADGYLPLFRSYK